MALILLCEEDIDPTGSDVRCVRNDRICDMILQLYLSAQCQITPLTTVSYTHLTLPTSQYV